MRVTKIKTKLLSAIIKLMGDKEEYSFHTILDYLNSTTRQGSTPKELSNILSKYPDFECVGSILGGNDYSEYQVTTWTISKWGIVEWGL